MQVPNNQLGQVDLRGVFRRPEAVDEFHHRHRVGEHVLFVGPTGRGKTTFAASLLAQPATTNTLTLSVKGRDPALSALGKEVPTWPPQRELWNKFKWKFEDKKKRIYRWEPEFKSEDDLRNAAAVTAKSLRWLWQQHDWTLYLPDLQMIADRGMMGLGKPVEAHLLTARSRDCSMWLDAQAPRWIPRAAADQTSHVFVFRNRDRDVQKRLAEITGFDARWFAAVVGQLKWHEIIWVDVRRDEAFLIECPCKECR